MNILALSNITVGQWLKYAIVSIPDHLFTAVPIILCSFALLYFVGGMVWGLLWNKKWSLSRSSIRFFSVGILSIVAALTLAAADSLQSAGSMFQTKMSPAVQSLTPDENNEVKITKEDAAYIFINGAVKKVCPIDIEGDVSDEESVVITPGTISDYSSSIMFLWSIFGTCLILLIGGVAMAAYSDIKEIKPIA